MVMGGDGFAVKSGREIRVPGRVVGRRRAARERALPNTHAKTSGGTTPSYAGSPGLRMKWRGLRTPSLP